ncbi:MAG: hypothetical protein A2057_05885 [Ignavibacteria bacterium GWA2_35_9]|nr:MAG: hypothetical protein A2057_05885 [Ignavibacteria bacterium GWA2_35_9]OGU49222.1 MAG: hypothetical protein A2080_12590 [Ignavibacteria bacterium GWC2_36_12]OGV10575.1 MAG: hypothetical protein A2330_04450 [Ignavibacteria bacterium RIFOXYB2_FULL_36_7]
MKKISIYGFAIITSLVLSACELYEPDDYYYDYDPPAVPGGIVVINGDNRVDLYWDDNYEDDLAGYNVYYSYEYDGKYTLIGSSQTSYFIDWESANGVTYYYAVTAYDYNGNESELSYDVVYATPRPEGFNQSIFNYNKYPENSGYSFSNYSVVPYDDLGSDFFFENYDGEFYLNVWDDTDIQNMGQTYDIYDIPYAPASGWNPSKYELAVVGHTYVIWTWNNHFAKVRVKSITNDRVVFDWAYQLVEGNRELKLNTKKGKREPLQKEKLTGRHNAGSN